MPNPTRWLRPMVAVAAVAGVATPRAAIAEVLGGADSLPAGTMADEAADPTERWSAVLRAYVTADGGFRYAALRAAPADLAELDAFIAWVGAPARQAVAGSERLAFLINAYNALAIGSVLAAWPLESVRDVPGFFDGRLHRVAGAEMTLNTLEADHLRAAFGEPRIHFLLHCASAGCPWLVADAVTAENLEALLEAQARAFVARTTRIGGPAQILASQIFEWYADDFGPGGGVRAFLAARLGAAEAAAVLDPTASLAYTPYDWALNAR